MSILTDIIETTALVTGKHNKTFEKYDNIYPFTTENITDTYTDLNNKSVLTVAGSGDQAINAIAAGASKVDVFDINKLTIYYLKLKKCAIEHLSFDEYHGLFNHQSVEMYKKLRDYLDDETLEYWDYYFSHFIYTEYHTFTNTELFYTSSDWKCYVERNPYLKQEVYEYVQHILPSKTIGFFNAPVNEVHKELKGKYDRIYLSNINRYISLESLRDTINNLSSYLEDAGKLYFAYIYSNEVDSISDSITSDHSLLVKSVINDLEKDKVLIHNKTSN